MSTCPPLGPVRSLRVEVTEEDIRQGQRGDCGACPVALAVSRAYDSPCRVGVDEVHQGISTQHGLGVKLPGFVISWIAAFDAQEAAFPISFYLLFREPRG